MKEPAFYAGFGAPNTVFSEGAPLPHRDRRKLLNPFFSKQNIASMQPVIDSKLNEMIDKIGQFQQEGAIHMYSATRSVEGFTNRDSSLTLHTVCEAA
jgi:cytochrome P450